MSAEYDIRITRYSSPVDVEAIITEQEHWRAVPAVKLHETDLSDVHSTLYRDEQFNFSFAAQLAIVQAQIALNYDPTKVGYFYTAYSASPLAHTIRGYFDERDEPYPLISHISKRSETTRLHEIISSHSLTSAVILDEFMNKGTTLHAARLNLVNAGMEEADVQLVGARLYGQLWKGPAVANEHKFADLDPNTHELAGQFYRAGKILARQCTKA